MTPRKPLALAAILLLAPFAHAKVCIAHDFGATADGVTPATAGLQKAIDACSAPDATIELTAGTYLSAPLTLHSHTHLVLDAGAIILGSLNMVDYPIRTEPENKWRRTALIHADNTTDISITGAGVIDGSGQPWWQQAKEHRAKADTSGNAPGFQRPLLVDLVKVTHVLFDGITLRNAPMYNIALFGSSDIVIQNIKIRNPQFSPNTDGIDPFYSSHIKIDHVSIDTGDDYIAIKSGLVERGDPDTPSFDITVTNSEMFHGHGISIGSELAGGVHDVTVDNVTFNGGDWGIRIKSGRTRGNDIYNLKYSNIKMSGVKLPIFITGYYPKIPATDTAQPMTEHTPRFHDITIQNMTATGAAMAMQIAGLPESPIRNLVIENVDISAIKGARIQNAELTEKNVILKVSIPPIMTQGEGVKLQQLK